MGSPGVRTKSRPSAVGPSLSAVPPSSCRGKQDPRDLPGRATPRVSGRGRTLASPDHSPAPGAPPGVVFFCLHWKGGLRRPPLFLHHRLPKGKSGTTKGVNQKTNSCFVALRSGRKDSPTSPASLPEAGLCTRGPAHPQRPALRLRPREALPGESAPA